MDDATEKPPDSFSPRIINGEVDDWVLSLDSPDSRGLFTSPTTDERNDYYDAVELVKVVQADALLYVHDDAAIERVKVVRADDDNETTATSPSSCLSAGEKTDDDDYSVTITDLEAFIGELKAVTSRHLEGNPDNLELYHRLQDTATIVQLTRGYCGRKGNDMKKLFKELVPILKPALRIAAPPEPSGVAADPAPSDVENPPKTTGTCTYEKYDVVQIKKGEKDQVDRIAIVKGKVEGEGNCSYYLWFHGEVIKKEANHMEKQTVVAWKPSTISDGENPPKTTCTYEKYDVVKILKGEKDQVDPEKDQVNRIAIVKGKVEGPRNCSYYLWFHGEVIKKKTNHMEKQTVVAWKPSTT